MTGAMNMVEEMKRLFDLYDFSWMERTFDSFSVDMVNKLYAKYMATMYHQTPPRQKVKEQP